MEYEKWFKPYKTLSGPQAITEANRFLRELERFGEATGLGSPPSRNEKWWERLRFIEAQESIGLEDITFDYPYTDPGDSTRYEGDKIYYPFRTPSLDEFIKSRKLASGDTVGIVEGFGHLFSCGFAITQMEFIELFGKKIYPFGLFLRTPNGIFYSIADVIEEDEEKEMGSLKSIERQTHVVYMRWKPYEDVNADVGIISVPLELPTLQSLEFRLSKLDEGFIYENRDFFVEK